MQRKTRLICTARKIWGNKHKNELKSCKLFLRGHLNSPFVISIFNPLMQFVNMFARSISCNINFVVICIIAQFIAFY